MYVLYVCARVCVCVYARDREEDRHIPHLKVETCVYMYVCMLVRVRTYVLSISSPIFPTFLQTQADEHSDDLHDGATSIDQRASERASERERKIERERQRREKDRDIITRRK